MLKKLDGTRTECEAIDDRKHCENDYLVLGIQPLATLYIEYGGENSNILVLFNHGLEAL
jgi:hypothetical protein